MRRLPCNHMILVNEIIQRCRCLSWTHTIKKRVAGALGFEVGGWTGTERLQGLLALGQRVGRLSIKSERLHLLLHFLFTYARCNRPVVTAVTGP